MSVLFRIASCMAVFTLLCISGVCDIKHRRIPRFCSYGLLFISFLMLILERKYILAVYFIVSILATGQKWLRIPLLIWAVIVFANTGEAAAPLVFGLAAADMLFSLRIIGGGDAQMLFALLGFGHQDWKMAASVSMITLIAGTAAVIRVSGFRNAGERILSAASNMRSGNIENDTARLRIPFAAILPVSFLLYLFVSFRK